MNLTDADLDGGYLLDANLTEANLYNTNFRKADLRGLNIASIKNWETISDLTLANIYAVKNPPNGFIEFAKARGAVEIKDVKEWEKLLEAAKSKAK